MKNMPNVLTLVALALFLGGVGTGCATGGGGGGGGGGDDVGPVGPDAEAGAATYDAQCVACRGTPGEGGETDLAGKGAAELTEGATAEGHPAVTLTEEDYDNLAAYLAEGTDGDGDGDGNGDGDGDGDGDGAEGELHMVDSGIALHSMSRIEVGDDIIVYMYPAPEGNPGAVNYMVPSAGDTAGRGIPDDQNYAYHSFAVCGKKIALVGGSASAIAYQVAIYDTAAGTTSLIPVEDIRIGTIPVGPSDPGHIQADGNYVVTRNDASPVVRVIDVSGAEPVVIPLTVDPGGATSPFSVPQVLVDAETMTAVAVNNTDDTFYVYDIENPDAAPVAFPTTDFGGFDDGFQYKMDDGVVLYGNGDGYNRMYLLDVTDPASTPVELATGEGLDPEVFDGYYGYLSTEGAASATSASAVGAVGNAAPLVADDTTILADSANWGMYGQGGSIAIGELGGDVIWLVAGPVQWSTTGGSSGAWNVVYHPDDPATPLFGSGVVTNQAGTLLGFAAGSLGSDESTLWYAILGD